jgi:hypothetical protein
VLGCGWATVKEKAVVHPDCTLEPVLLTVNST